MAADAVTNSPVSYFVIATILESTVYVFNQKQAKVMKSYVKSMLHFTRCMHDVHEMNVILRNIHVHFVQILLTRYLAVRPVDSTRKPLDGFGLNLVWTLSHWGLP
jgi:hypothetical protein